MTDPYQRSRSRAEDTSTETMYYKYKDQAPVVHSAQTVHSQNESITDVVTPGYQKRVQRGEIVNNPCYYELNEFTSDGGSSYAANYIGANPPVYYSLSGGSFSQIRSPYMPAWHDNDIANVIASCVSQAKLKALANMAASPWAFGEDVLEIRETLRLLRDPLDGMKTFFKAASRQANGRNLWRTIQASAGLWNQYRFAVSPLYRSVSDLADALQQGDHTLEGERLSSRGFSKETYNRAGTEILTTDNESYTWYMSDKFDLDFHATILYRVKNPISGWRHKYGLRLRDVPHTAWQVIPLSFMVDRMVNISDSIRALTNLADPNLQILAGSYRGKVETEKRYQLLAETSSVWSISVTADECVDKHFHYQREVWEPSISDAIPEVTPTGLVDEATKIADLLSIIISYVKK